MSQSSFLEGSVRFFGGPIIHHVHLAAEKVFLQAQELDPTDAGGWFTCWRNVGRVESFPVYVPTLGFVVGEVPIANINKYKRYADEKAERLSGQPTHVSSWQSRDPEQHRYGGAIRIDGGILAFSGLAEEFDELLMAMTALHLQQIDAKMLKDIMNASDNPHLRAFLLERGVQ